MIFYFDRLELEKWTMEERYSIYFFVTKRNKILDIFFFFSNVSKRLKNDGDYGHLALFRAALSVSFHE